MDRNIDVEIYSPMGMHTGQRQPLALCSLLPMGKGFFYHNLT